jgi:hypothetical protein
VIAKNGAISTRSREFRLLKCGLQNNKLPNLTSEMLHGALFLTRFDLLGFLILLSLETGLEIECLIGLSADCLQNPSRGYVDIEYFKRRAAGEEWKRLRVRDGGSTTPGGLIRVALKITERARHHLATDKLWAWWDGYKLQTGRPQQGAIKSYVAHHGLKGDDGLSFHLELSKLRKTHKAERYLRTQGQLDDFAVGHSIPVAANHYADIPSLRNVHERTVADALQDALGATFKPTIVLPSMEKVARMKPRAGDLPPVANHIPSSLDSDEDVWLASCRGFYTSPFGSTSEPCPTPFWGCLECKNAVISARKLPALIAFDMFMVGQRAVMDGDAWAARFGTAHYRIAEQILPAFPPLVVTEARAAAADAGSSLLYLPPEAQAS